MDKVVYDGQKVHLYALIEGLSYTIRYHYSVPTYVESEKTDDSGNKYMDMHVTKLDETVVEYNYAHGKGLVNADTGATDFEDIQFGFAYRNQYQSYVSFNGLLKHDYIFYTWTTDATKLNHASFPTSETPDLISTEYFDTVGNPFYEEIYDAGHNIIEKEISSSMRPDDVYYNYMHTEGKTTLDLYALYARLSEHNTRSDFGAMIVLFEPDAESPMRTVSSSPQKVFWEAYLNLNLVGNTRIIFPDDKYFYVPGKFNHGHDNCSISF